MTDQWLHAWFPVLALTLQMLFWGLAIPRIASPETVAVLTFTNLPEDPDF